MFFSFDQLLTFRGRLPTLADVRRATRPEERLLDGMLALGSGMGNSVCCGGWESAWDGILFDQYGIGHVTESRSHKIYNWSEFYNVLVCSFFVARIGN